MTLKIRQLNPEIFSHPYYFMKTNIYLFITAWIDNFDLYSFYRFNQENYIKNYNYPLKN